MRAHRQSGLLLLLLLLEHVGIRGQLPEPRVGPLQQDFRGGSVGGVRGQAQRNDVGHPRAVALIGGGRRGGGGGFRGGGKHGQEVGVWIHGPGV